MSYAGGMFIVNRPRDNPPAEKNLLDIETLLFFPSLSFSLGRKKKKREREREREEEEEGAINYEVFSFDGKLSPGFCVCVISARARARALMRRRSRPEGGITRA
jgi:hypothetical protein